MKIHWLFALVLGCLTYNCRAETLKTEAGTYKSEVGSSLLPGNSESGLSSGNGSSLSATSSGLAAVESDLGTAIHLAADVLFGFDKADIKPEAAPLLEKVAAMIREKQPKQVQIHGYTDSKGSEQYNQVLSQARAQAVANWLASHYITLDILVTAGFGETHPVAPNQNQDGSDNPEGRKLNRRVDILLNKKFSPIKPLGQE